MATRHLHAVDPEHELAQEHMRERILREALQKLAQAERETRHAMSVIHQHGREFVNAKYRGERIITRPTVERLRRELGL